MADGELVILKNVAVNAVAEKEPWKNIVIIQGLNTVDEVVHATIMTQMKYSATENWLVLNKIAMCANAQDRVVNE